MTTKQDKPFQVTVWGESRTVVHRGKGFWTERRPDGQLVHHAGNLLDNQQVRVTLDKARPCEVCKQPAWHAKPRQRTKGIHMMCEPSLDVLPDDVHWAVVFGMAADLGATCISTGSKPATPEREVRRAA